MADNVAPKMHANAIAERPRALIADPFLAHSHAKKIPVRRGRRDDADWLFFTALAGHKRKRAGAHLQPLEPKHQHLPGRGVAMFGASRHVVAAGVPGGTA